MNAETDQVLSCRTTNLVNNHELFSSKLAVRVDYRLVSVVIQVTRHIIDALW